MMRLFKTALITAGPIALARLSKQQYPSLQGHMIDAAFGSSPMVRVAVSGSPDGVKYHGISLHVNTSPPGEPETQSPAPIELNKLTNLDGVIAWQLSFDSRVAIHVDVDSVECRAYKDAAGVQPLGVPFSNSKPTEMGETSVIFGSVLCYIAVEV